MLYRDLKQNIISDLNGRDDLTDAIVPYIEGVIRSQQRSYYYAAPITAFTFTEVGREIYPSRAVQEGDTLPTEFTQIKYMRLLVDQVWQWLYGPVDYVYLLQIDNNQPPTQSQPTAWALYDSSFRLFSAPDQIYKLELTGNGKIPIPENDDASNFWTENAADLIRYMTIAQIYAIKLNDPQRASQAMEVAEMYRLSLVRETNTKVMTGQIRAYW